MAPVRHRWSINDVIGEIRNTAHSYSSLHFEPKTSRTVHCTLNPRLPDTPYSPGRSIADLFTVLGRSTVAEPIPDESNSDFALTFLTSRCLTALVADPPHIIDVGPDRVMTAPLYSQATFSCTAEGNPSPSYQWLQKLPTQEGTVLIRSSDARLHINNVTYDYKGDYVCKATNVIAGVERLVQSEAISVQVIMAKKWEYKGTVHQLFIAFKKAYDSVKREVLYDILIEFGIPKKLVRLIKMCLSESP
ncbi:hypothetical protein ANN_09294 [Periplaneta americana]|uniref:Ig-like domain-containing protein n=1 Tax=Periplaneta americana TaxID=6978 RepID=A0ABQ8TNG1_PERAM|nr:hypothetical protein ANN_09294 [Periplaneta americana]